MDHKHINRTVEEIVLCIELAQKQDSCQPEETFNGTCLFRSLRTQLLKWRISRIKRRFSQNVRYIQDTFCNSYFSDDESGLRMCIKEIVHRTMKGHLQTNIRLVYELTVLENTLISALMTEQMIKLDVGPLYSSLEHDPVKVNIFIDTMWTMLYSIVSKPEIRLKSINVDGCRPQFDLYFTVLADVYTYTKTIQLDNISPGLSCDNYVNLFYGLITADSVRRIDCQLLHKLMNLSLLDGNTFLHLLCRSELTLSLELLGEICEFVEDINCTNDAGETPLNVYVSSLKNVFPTDTRKYIFFLISHGSDVMTTDLHGNTPLLNASKNRNIQLWWVLLRVEEVLNGSAERQPSSEETLEHLSIHIPNAIPEYSNMTIEERLYWSYLNGNKQGLHACIDEVTQVCMRNQNCWSDKTVIMKRKRTINQWIVESALCEYNLQTDLYYRKEDQLTPLSACVLYIHSDLLSDYRTQTDEYVDRVLHLFITLCGRQGIRFQVNTAVWLRGGTTRPALFWALYHRLPKCTATLVHNGARWQCISPKDTRKIFWQWRYNHNYTENLLACLPPHQLASLCSMRDDDGNILLHWLCGGKIKIPSSDEVFNTVLRYTPDLNCRDGVGRTPLYSCICDGKPNFIRSLILHGADINHITYAGETPLLAAIVTRDIDLCMVLLTNGAMSLGTKCMLDRRYRHEVDAWFIRNSQRLDECSPQPEIYSVRTHIAYNSKQLIKLFSSTLYGSPLVLCNAYGFNRHITNVYNKYITKVVMGYVCDIVKGVEFSTKWHIRATLAGSCREGTKLGLLDEFDIQLVSNDFDHNDAYIIFANTVTSVINKFKGYDNHENINIMETFTSSGPAYKLKCVITLSNCTHHDLSVDLVPVMKKKYGGQKVDYIYNDKYTDEAKQIIEYLCNDPFYLKLVSGDPAKSHSSYRQELQVMNTVKCHHKLGYIMAKFMNMAIQTGDIARSRFNKGQDLIQVYQNGSDTAGCDSYVIKMSHFNALNKVKNEMGLIAFYRPRRRFRQRRRPVTVKRLPNDPGLMVKSLIHADITLRNTLPIGTQELFKLTGVISYLVVHNYDAHTDDELSVTTGDVITNVKWIDECWQNGFNSRFVYGTVQRTGQRGLVLRHLLENLKEGVHRVFTNGIEHEHQAHNMDEVSCRGMKYTIDIKKYTGDATQYMSQIHEFRERKDVSLGEYSGEADIITDVIDHGFVLGTLIRTGERGLIPVYCVQLQY